ncbi:hypothetical protein ACOMHN_026777 [Nucella lapillus]
MKLLCCKYIAFPSSLFILLALGFTSPADSQALLERDSRQGQNLSNVDLQSLRLDTARLHSYLRGVFVSQEKVPPYVSTPEGRVVVDVQLVVAVVSVLSLRDVDKTLSTNVLIKLYWADPALRWNSSQHGGVISVKMAAGSIWTPDVYIFNSVDKNVLLSDTDVVTITADGQVSAPLDVIVQTFCNTKLDQFPFDSQTCIITFHSKKYWRHIRLSLRGVYSSNSTALFAYSSEWVLTNQGIVNITVGGVFGQDPMCAMSLEISRKTLFYELCLVMPMILTSFMNTLVFLVPLQSGDKISFLVTIFVSISVFISFFTDVMPRGLDSIPATLKLLIGVMTQSLLSMLATLVLMNRDKAFESHTRRCCDAVEHNPGSKPESKVEISAIPTAKLTAAVIPNWSNDVTPTSVDSADVSPTPILTSRNRCQNHCLPLTPKRLDRSLFVLAFALNVLFLGSIWWGSF